MLRAQSILRSIQSTVKNYNIIEWFTCLLNRHSGEVDKDFIAFVAERGNAKQSRIVLEIVSVVSHNH